MGFHYILNPPSYELLVNSTSDGSKIGRHVKGYLFLHQIYTVNAMDVELKTGKSIQISISRATPWTRLLNI